MYSLKCKDGSFYKSNMMNIIVEITQDKEDAKRFATKEEAQAVIDKEPKLLETFEIVEN